MFGLSLIPRITEYLKDVLKQLDVGELENFQMTTCTGCVWTEVDAGELGIAALCGFVLRLVGEEWPDVNSLL